MDRKMDRLTYQRYNNTDDIITISLHNGYTAVAIKSWNNWKHIYDVELRLKEDTVDKWDFVGNLTFNASYKHINTAILKHVAKLLEKGFFDQHIQKSEYELECFDRGNELFEEERLKKNA